MNGERPEPNPYSQFEQFRAEFESAKQRYLETYSVIAKIPGYRAAKSHFDNIAPNLITPLEWVYKIQEHGDKPALTLDQFKTRLQALNDYLDMLDADPDFFKGEVLEEGTYPALAQTADKISGRGKVPGFSPQIFYVSESKKIFDKSRSDK